MEQPSCLRKFARYTSLSVLGTLGVSCYILADTFFISRGLGADGLTALNLAIPVYNFIFGAGLMLGMGGATKFSICKSQGDEEKANHIYLNTLYLGGLFSVLFLLPGLFRAEELAVLLGAEGAVLPLTCTYLRWLLLFSPAFIFNNILLCFVRNDGGPQLSMAAMIIGSLSNILLDYLFIFPLGMGIFGAIFATGLSPLISMAAMAPHWRSKGHTLRFLPTKPDPQTALQTMALGFPSLVAQLSSGIVMILFNFLILRLEGNIGVAAYGVIANIALVATGVYTGVAQGVQPLLSSFYGQGDYQQARKVQRYGVVTAVLIAAATELLLFVFASPVTAVFNSEGLAPMQTMAEGGLRLYFLSSVFAAYNTLLSNFFASVELPLPAQLLSILRGFVLIIPMAFLLAASLGMTGVWLACPITEFLAALVGFLLYKRCRCFQAGRAC